MTGEDYMFLMYSTLLIWTRASCRTSLIMSHMSHRDRHISGKGGLLNLTIVWSSMHLMLADGVIGIVRRAGLSSIWTGMSG
jgi:hypothetical protein